jgi:hypothetical protein
MARGKKVKIAGRKGHMRKKGHKKGHKRGRK